MKKSKNLKLTLKEELGSIRIALCSVSSVQKDAHSLSLLKELPNRPTCYVTLSKASSFLTEKLRDSSQEVFIIDAVSSLFKETKEEDNCLFVSSPNDLVELSIAISEVIKQRPFDHLILDSLATLFTLHKYDVEKISKFLTQVIYELQRKHCKAFFICDKKDENSNIILQNASLFDANLSWDEEDLQWRK